MRTIRRSLLLPRAVLALGGAVALGAVLVQPAGAQQMATPGSPNATVTIDGHVLQPQPYWPSRFAPPKGAPNNVLIMTDDVELRRASRS